METERRSIRSRVVGEMFTCLAFWITMAAMPALALSYVVVRVSKHLWLKLLSSRYPALEFITTDTVRSLLDTHRNQGIINVLLSISGDLNEEAIRQHVTRHLIDRRDKSGHLIFPRLRQVLVSCWGNYAWDRNVPFALENHFIVSKGMYRGRPVSDANIQEYVSDIVSKYFPSDQPPWQYIVIPCQPSTEPKYYILVRVHHLLLSGKNSLNIGDLLLVEQLKPEERIPQTEYIKASPLGRLFPIPSAIPELFEKLSENLSNAWNEFISEYDPVESPRALKTLPGAFHIAGLVLISGACAVRELTKKRDSDTMREGTLTATALLAAIQRECKRRNLTLPKIVLSPLVTADPRKWPRRAVVTTLTTVKTSILLPFRVLNEIRALYELIKTGRVNPSNTMTWKYAGILQLLGRGVLEAWQGMLQAYRAPALLWTETIGADDGKKHLLQTSSLCGRKVAAWSKPVSRAGIERAARALGVSCTDISLYGATEGLRAFFEQSQNETPETVLTTARAATEDFLFTFAEGDGKMYKKSQTGGMVCLALPIGASPRRIASVLNASCRRQLALAGAWAAQARCGALTRAVPSPLARLTLNLLSRRYAVSYAEIEAPPTAAGRRTLWGQRIDQVVYWRPPQANISMSLTVIQYADTVRLSVMTDARLSPAHRVPALRWATAIDQLIAKVDQELTRIATNLNIPQIIAPEEEHEPVQHSSLESSQSSALLSPPSTTVVSPPPMRRRITHN